MELKRGKNNNRNDEHVVACGLFNENALKRPQLSGRFSRRARSSHTLSLFSRRREMNLGKTTQG